MSLCKDRWTILVCLSLAAMISCSSNSDSTENNSTVVPNGSGDTSGSADGGGTGSGTGTGTGNENNQIPAPAQLPTVVDLDWASFPTDPGPNYAPTGKTWFVKSGATGANAGTESDPFTSISKAISSANAGDLIRIKGGTYQESLSISKDNLIITAATGEKVTLVASGKQTGLNITGSNVVINGIDLQGFNPAVQMGRSDKTQTNVVISNATVTAPNSGSFTDGIVDYLDTHGQGRPSLEGLLLKNIKITGYSLSVSCNTGPCKSWRLENVSVVGDGSNSGWGGDGVAFEDGDNLLFFNVEVSNTSSDGIDTKATRVVVWNSFVHDVANNGMKLWRGGDIVNSRVMNLHNQAAIVADNATKLRILHSAIVSHQDWSVVYNYNHQDQAIDVEFTNNIISGALGGLLLPGKIASLKINNNIFHGITNGNILRQGSNYITDQAGLTAHNWGANNLLVNPQIDEKAHLKSGSPGIDKGIKTALYPDFDAAGNARVKGSAPDIGPFEDF